MHGVNVLQRLVKAVAKNCQRAAKESQTGGKQAAVGGKKPAKHQTLFWPVFCLQTFHHVVIASGRPIGSWSF